MQRRNREAWALGALLVLHIVLGVYWSVTIPIWEAYDEHGHYAYVRYLAQERKLPPKGLKLTPENDETQQPPLYYALAALPLTLIDINDRLVPVANQFSFRGPVQGGYNRFVHDSDTERWPYRGDVLAIHIARWVSALLGALGLIFTYLTGRTLFPEQPWVRWGAVLIHAFWPQYRFASATINNDILVAVSVGAVMWLLARIVMSRQLRTGDALALGIATGISLLSKINGIAALPVIFIVLLGSVILAVPSQRKRLVPSAIGSSLLGLTIIGAWCVHNIRMGTGALGSGRNLGALVKLVVMMTFGEGRERWRRAIPMLGQSIATYWASLGWGNLNLPDPLYWLAAAWAIAGIAGLLTILLRRPARRLVAGLVSALLCMASVLAVSLLYSLGGSNPRYMPGRYLLPALSGVSVLLSAGWNTLLRRRGRNVGWAAMAGLMGGLACLIPELYIRPAYSPPPHVAERDVADYVPLHYYFGDFVELVGYRLEDNFAEPQDTVHLKLAWRTLKRADANYALAIQAFESERTLLGEVHRFLGRGALSTTNWEPGYLFVEEVAIPIKSEGRDGHMAWIEVSFYDPNGIRPVAVTRAAGEQLGWGIRLATIKVRGTSPLGAVGQVRGLQFGPGFRLVGSRVDGRAPANSQLAVTLNWASIVKQESDYTVSLQLRNPNGVILAQVDNQPQHGAYPTSFWEPGEAISDPYTLDLPAGLPAGTYNLYLCMYDLATLQRLPILGPDSQALPNDEAALYTCIVGQDGVLAVKANYPWLAGTN